MRVAVVLVLVLSLMSEASDWDSRKRPHRGGFFRRPTRDQHGALSANTTITFLREQLAKMTSAFTPMGGYALTRGEDERRDLIDYLWKGDYTDSSSEMLRANPELATMLVAKTSNSSYSPVDNVAFHYKREKRLDFLAGLLTRNRNVHICPKQQAILAVTAKQKHINNDFWEVP
jgi:hypothetical protein